MLLINGITDNADQSRSIALSDESTFELRLRFLPFQNAWFMDITYQGFTAKSIKVVNHYNLLRLFKNIIPFGISCLTNDDRDPSFIQDFSSGHSQLYLLLDGDIGEIEGALRD